MSKKNETTEPEVKAVTRDEGDVADNMPVPGPVQALHDALEKSLEKSMRIEEATGENPSAWVKISQETAQELLSLFSTLDPR